LAKSAEWLSEVDSNYQTRKIKS